ncbi:MAG TPA: hypothetical protein VM487_19145 [Phycisphaerae bacterium]|nr:hypothetical protein [Phycisphaerae bacterium]
MADPGRGPLIDLDGRRLFQVIHGGLFARLPFEVHEEVRKKLAKEDPTDPATRAEQRTSRSAVQQETQEIADKLGIKVPDWWDDEDPWEAPPDFSVGNG